MYEDDKQIKVLIDDNDKGETVLALFEIGTSWRSEYVNQVNPGDVIFLFRRGGAGYIGAFIATDTKVLEWDEKYRGETADLEKIKRYDMYDGFEDGIADYLAVIFVRPLAFNCNGVGCKSPRRKTIDPIHDQEAVNYLLTRFSGNELTENQKAGMNKYKTDDDKLVNVNMRDVDQAFFKNLAETELGKIHS
jgi:hypothetical protein